MNLRHTENCKIGFDKFIQIQQWRVVQSIVNTTGNYSLHIFRYRHSFTIHDNALPHFVGGSLVFKARFPFGIKHHAIGSGFFNHITHPCVMILVPGAFVPGIIADKKLCSIVSAKFSKFFYFCCPTRQSPVQVPLVPLIETQHRPIRPDSDYIVTTIKFVPFFEELLHMKRAICGIIILMIPVHHQVHGICMPDPFQIGPLKKCIIKYSTYIIKKTILEHQAQTFLPLTIIKINP